MSLQVLGNTLISNTPTHLHVDISVIAMGFWLVFMYVCTNHRRVMEVPLEPSRNSVSLRIHCLLEVGIDIVGTARE